MAAIDFDVWPDGEPQKRGTNWFARERGSRKQPFLVGQTVSYNDGDGSHRGLYQTKVIGQLPKLHYDRAAAARKIGLWGHFIWPTVTAESSGHHLLVNTYDRARFTFGFYQLAAHTPRDNLILLFRKLLQLPKAAAYFPDLELKNGLVHRRDVSGSLVSLETVTNVHRPNGKFEDQIVSFMTYLNPDTTTAGEAEVRTAAKLMHWLVNDEEAVNAAVEIPFQIMQRKVKAQAALYRLRGKDPRLAIWVSDIRHQSRGGEAQIKAALSKPDLDAQLSALFDIGSGVSGYDGRRRTVRACIKTLTDEGVFDGVKLGDAALPLT